MRQFIVTSISDHAVNLENIFTCNDVENLLNQNLTIDHYSEKIQQLFFISVATEPGKGIPRPDGMSYHWKHKTLKLIQNLNYDSFRKASKDEALHMMADLYLSSIDTYISKRKDFDAKRFYNDVDKLFEPILKSKT